MGSHNSAVNTRVEDRPSELMKLWYEVQNEADSHECGWNLGKLMPGRRRGSARGRGGWLAGTSTQPGACPRGN